MKKITFYLAAIALATTLSATAQPPHGHKGKPSPEKIAQFKAERKAYLIDKVGLTTEEQTKFFPLYEEMQEKIFTLKRTARKVLRTVERDTEKIADEIYLQAATTAAEVDYQKGLIDKEYFEKFKQILNPKKLFKLIKAEIHFPQEMLRKHGGKGETTPSQKSEL